MNKEKVLKIAQQINVRKAHLDVIKEALKLDLDVNIFTYNNYTYNIYILKGNCELHIFKDWNKWMGAENIYRLNKKEIIEYMKGVR